MSVQGDNLLTNTSSIVDIALNCRNIAGDYLVFLRGMRICVLENLKFIFRKK